MKIFITGHNGFVGSNFLNNFSNYQYFKYNKGDKISINEEIVLHFAGKAHDVKNFTNSSIYFNVNTNLTIKIFDEFLNSNAKVFITISSIKAVTDFSDTIITESYVPNPKSHYGRSKLMADEYIFSKKIPKGKRVYILRPCIIHGPGNKGNLNLLLNYISFGLPWPLGNFNNKRSFCSINNLCFIINELILNDLIPNGIYNIADDIPLSSNDLIKIFSKFLNKKIKILNISPKLIYLIAALGDFFHLPFNSDRLNKLTQTFIVSNEKIKKEINKKLPFSTYDGLFLTLNSYKKNV